MAQPNFAERLGELKQRGLVTLVEDGVSEAEIAKRLGMHRSTLRPYVKAVKHELDEPRLGPPEDSQGPPLPPSADGPPEVHPHPPREHRAMPSTGIIGPPEVHQGLPLSQMDDGIPDIHHSPPPLYIHPGIPDDSTEEPVLGAEAIAGLQQGIPSLSLVGIRKEPPEPSPALQGMAMQGFLLDELALAWPELTDMLLWWRERHQQAQAPREKLERVTYHVHPRWIDAVKQETDRTGDSYAAVVNRAFRRYFEGR